MSENLMAEMGRDRQASLLSEEGVGSTSRELSQRRFRTRGLIIATCTSISLLLTVLFVFLAVPNRSAKHLSMLQFTDLHWDTLYNSTISSQCKCRQQLPKCILPEPTPFMGQYGCDSPKSLIRSALDEAKVLYPDPDIIILNGDMGRHALEHADDVTLLIESGIHRIKHTYPDVPIIFSFGNNDFFPNYAAPINGSRWYSDIDDVIGEVIHADENFKRSGYYRYNINSKLAVVSLNTILYALWREHDPEDDPNNQFKWLIGELDEARSLSQKVIIVGHVPPTYDMFCDPSKGGNVTMQWKSHFADRYHSIMRNYGDVVTLQLFGHTHTEGFRIPSDNVAPIMLAGSVSPCYYANPSFRMLQYGIEEHSLLDMATHYLPLSSVANVTDYTQWIESYASFALRYSVFQMDTPSLSQLWKRLSHDEDSFSKWISSAYSQSPAGEGVDGNCRAQQLCAVKCVTPQCLNECISTIPTP